MRGASPGLVATILAMTIGIASLDFSARNDGADCPQGFVNRTSGARTGSMLPWNVPIWHALSRGCRTRIARYCCKVSETIIDQVANHQRQVAVFVDATDLGICRTGMLGNPSEDQKFLGFGRNFPECNLNDLGQSFADDPGTDLMRLPGVCGGAQV